MLTGAALEGAHYCIHTLTGAALKGAHECGVVFIQSSQPGVPELDIHETETQNLRN